MAPTALDALNSTIEQEYDKILRYARSRFRNQQEAEDAAHSAISKALEYLKRHPDFYADCWPAWLWCVVNTGIVDAQRQEIRYRTYVHEEDCGEVKPEARAYEVDYVEVLRQAEAGAAVEGFVQNAMSPKQRQPFILRYFEEKSYAEIAEIVRDATPTAAQINAIKSQVRRGMESLRDRMTTAVLVG